MEYLQSPMFLDSHEDFKRYLSNTKKPLWQNIIKTKGKIKYFIK